MDNKTARNTTTTSTGKIKHMMYTQYVPALLMHT